MATNEYFGSTLTREEVTKSAETISTFLKELAMFLRHKSKSYTLFESEKSELTRFANQVDRVRELIQLWAGEKISDALKVDARED